MYAGPGPDIGGAIKLVLGALAISIPLGLWKLGEIVYWLATHVTVAWQ